CAYCIDMHSKDARAAGESEQRLYELDAWRETPFYTERERAALAWTEAITEVAETHVPDDVFEEVKKQFSDKEIVHLTLAAAMIKLWNRMAIATAGRARTLQGRRGAGLTEQRALSPLPEKHKAGDLRHQIFSSNRGPKDCQSPRSSCSIVWLLPRVAR